MVRHASSFGTAPFRVSDGLCAGFSRAELDGPGFERPFYGVREPKYAHAERAASDGLSSREVALRLFKRNCRAFATRMGEGDFFSHGTALILRGSPTPAAWDRMIHVSSIRPRNPARTTGVISHRLAVRAPAYREVGGLRVEDPARAWVQASAHLTDVELIIAADHLVARRRRLATIDELRAEACSRRKPRLELLLDLVREGSESPYETDLRLQIVGAGLPEPELGFNLYADDGRFVARLDQAYPEFRVGVEYDGRQHAADVHQFARDADRWREIDETGWRLVRILKHHLEPDPTAAVDMVRNALLRAGWRP
ncbi:hypothetical protein [Microbacterium sp. B35-30]|uniref:hypothetical protein n=1 Tax=Microbacterium sp. B35-30 TaxID=1962642 RepID=UPI0013D00E1E|nr:hypothetical protein [Microbacterium sp. B35-30]KAF2415785.1 hypothetical protein B2K11_18655 [Microbacterium sp. B35-30]